MVAAVPTAGDFGEGPLQGGEVFLVFALDVLAGAFVAGVEEVGVGDLGEAERRLRRCGGCCRRGRGGGGCGRDVLGWGVGREDEERGGGEGGGQVLQRDFRVKFAHGFVLRFRQALADGVWGQLHRGNGFGSHHNCLVVGFQREL